MIYYQLKVMMMMTMTTTITTSGQSKLPAALRAAQSAGI